MRNIKSVLFLFALTFSITASFAQRYDDHDRDRDRNRNGRFYANRRFNRCNTPFSMNSFNRDFRGLSTTSYYHLDRELKDYSRSHCLTTEQISRLAMLYPTERERFDFMIFSLSYVFDIDNYSSAGSIFTNFNSRDAFYRFLLKQGVPTGDYFAGVGYPPNGEIIVAPAPQYYDRNGNPIPIYDNRTGAQVPQYYDQNGNPIVTYDNRNTPPAPQYFDRNGNPVPAYDNRTMASAPQYYDRNGNPMSNSNPNAQYNYPPQGSTIPNSNFNGALVSYKEFDVIKNRVTQTNSDNSKLDLAKQISKENKLTSNQIAELTRLLNFDTNRINYAKYAFDYVYDRENYVVVSDAMSYEVNKKDLIQYIESRKR